MGKDCSHYPINFKSSLEFFKVYYQEKALATTLRSQLFNNINFLFEILWMRKLATKITFYVYKDMQKYKIIYIYMYI